MRKALIGMAAAGAFLLAQPAAAEPVTDWWDFANRIAQTAQGPSGQPGTPDQQRAVTRTALAMFEAVNAIDRRYTSYLGFPVADLTASPDAAAATAAFKVLLHHFPAQRPALEESYAIAMAAIPDEPRREAGRLIGEAGGGGDRGGGDRSGHRPDPLSPAHDARRMDRRLAAGDRSVHVGIPPLGDPKRRGAPAAAAARAHQPGLGARL